MLVGAALGLKGCEGQAKTVVPPATDDTELQTQAPETQTIEVNFDNGSAQLSQEDIVKLQNLPKDQYNVVVKGNQYQWHMNGQPCDPATNQRLQQNLDNQRAEAIRQYLPSANISITNPAGTQANATINGGGTIDFDTAQNMQQQAQGQTMQINENDIVRIVAECVKKIKETHKVLDPDDAAAEYKDTPYGAELARRAKNAKPYVKEAKKVGEDTKIALRNIRQNVNNDIKSDELPEDLHKQYKDGKEMMKQSKLDKAIDKAVAESINEIMQPGSLSHGTMRAEDLIPKFMSILFKEDPAKAREIWQKYPNLLQALCDKNAGVPTNWWDSEEAIEILNNDLFDVMNNYAPEGHYFGSHPGDGSDYGYWPNEDM